MVRVSERRRNGRRNGGKKKRDEETEKLEDRQNGRTGIDQQQPPPLLGACSLEISSAGSSFLTVLTSFSRIFCTYCIRRIFLFY